MDKKIAATSGITCVIPLVVLIFVFLFSLSVVFADVWVSKDSGTEHTLNDVYFFNSRVGWAVGGDWPGPATDSVILQTTDAGDTWTEQSSPTEARLYGVCFGNRTHGWAVGSNGIILRTTTGGDSWTIQQSSGPTLWDISCFDASTAVAVGELDYGRRPDGSFGSFGNIIKTINGGLEWTSQTFDDNGGLYGVYFVGSVGYAVGSGGIVYKSINSGDSWTVLPRVVSPTGIATGLSGVFFLTVDEGWIGSSGEIMYHTTTGGTSWTPVDTGEAVASFGDAFFKNTTHGWVVGQSTIRFTNDGGITWVNEVSDIPGDSTSLGLIPIAFVRGVQCYGQVCWSVGDEGTILKRGEQPVVVVHLPNETITLEVPEPSPDTDTAPPPQCPPVFDDCEAGWNPIFTYNTDGCATSYTCVEEDSLFLRLTKINPQKFSAFYNQIPGLGSNENINVYITTTDGKTLIISVIIEESTIKKVSQEELSDSNYGVFLSDQTMKKIMNSKDQGAAALRAVQKGEIRIQAKTLGGKLKVVLARIFLYFFGPSDSKSPY